MLAAQRVIQRTGWAVVTLAGLGRVCEGGEAPPRLATYRQEGRLTEFVTAAEDFLQQYPEAAEKPDLLLDLWAATVENRDQLAQRQVKLRILTELEDRTRSALVLATFPSGESFAKFLVEAFEDASVLRGSQLAEQHCRVARMAFKKWGSEPFKNDSLLLRTAVLAAAAEDAELLSACRGRLEATEKPGIKAVAMTMLRAPVDPVRRIVSLHALTDNSHAVWCKRYLLTHLSPTERNTPAIQAIDAQELLHQEEWEQALPIVNRLLAKEKRPQWQYWQILCLATLGREAEAAKAMSRFQPRKSGDQWHDLAGQIVAGRQGLLDNVETYAQAIVGVMQPLSSDVELAECWVNLQLSQETPALTFYAAVDTRKSELHVSVVQGQTVVFAQRSLAEESWFLLPGQDKIRHFQQRGMLPKSETDLTEAGASSPNGSLKLTMNTSVTYAEMTTFLKQVCGLYNCSTIEGARELLTDNLRHGGFPANPQVDAQQRRLVWQVPGIMQPRLDRIVLDFDQQHRLTNIEKEGLQVSKIRYGRSGDFTLSPPAWPDFPQVDRDKMDSHFWTAWLESFFSLAETARNQKPIEKMP